MNEFDIFGLQEEYNKAAMVLMPLPWELTTSYGRGAYNGPRAINEASSQIDYHDIELGEFWKQGIHMLNSHPDIFELHRLADPFAKEIIGHHSEFSTEVPAQLEDKLEAVNRACEEMVNIVKEVSKKVIDEKGYMGIVGGDHSSPQGLIEQIGENQKGNFGILHIDAHADLRRSYQGFTHSHASIMYNVINGPHAPSRLVQVGIRDFSSEEFVITQDDKRVTTFFDAHIKEQMFSGRCWRDICDEIIESLPDQIYVSCDIDGLSPELCPNTGTPVPGGLNFDQVAFLLKCLGESGKKWLGFDLCEVAPGNDSKNQWDGNVGARLLFKLCGWQMRSQS